MFTILVIGGVALLATVIVVLRATHLAFDIAGLDTVAEFFRQQGRRP